MGRIWTVILMVVLSSICFGQIADGLEVDISISPQVAGMHYNATALPNKQQATFGVSCSASGGPPGWIYVYTWSGAGLTFDDVHAASTTARANSPGKYSITCSVICHQPGYPNVNFFGDRTKPAVAIGGPLSYEVTESAEEAETPAHDDNVSTKPWHIQYFNFTFGVDAAPAGCQPPRHGIVRSYAGQPQGTTYAWTITGPAVAIFGSGQPISTALFCSPTAGSTRGGIKVRVTYNYTDPVDPTLTGSTPDDSEETPPPGMTEVAPLYYSFTAHRPNNVESIGKMDGIHETGTVWPDISGAWTWTDWYKHRLFDQNGDGQPGVWITERFPLEAEELHDWNRVTGQSIELESAGGTGLSWITRKFTSASPPILAGELNNLDEIGLAGIVAVSNHPNPAEYPPLVMTQQYFAATQNTTADAFGILVATFINSMWLGGTTHVKA